MTFNSSLRNVCNGLVNAKFEICQLTRPRLCNFHGVSKKRKFSGKFSELVQKKLKSNHFVTDDRIIFEENRTVLPEFQEATPKIKRKSKNWFDEACLPEETRCLERCSKQQQQQQQHLNNKFLGTYRLNYSTLASRVKKEEPRNLKSSPQIQRKIEITKTEVKPKKRTLRPQKNKTVHNVQRTADTPLVLGGKTLNGKDAIITIEKVHQGKGISTVANKALHGRKCQHSKLLPNTRKKIFVENITQPQYYEVQDPLAQEKIIPSCPTRPKYKEDLPCTLNIPGKEDPQPETHTTPSHEEDPKSRKAKLEDPINNTIKPEYQEVPSNGSGTLKVAKNKHIPRSPRKRERKSNSEGHSRRQRHCNDEEYVPAKRKNQSFRRESEFTPGKLDPKHGDEETSECISQKHEDKGSCEDIIDVTLKEDPIESNKENVLAGTKEFVITGAREEPVRKRRPPDEDCDHKEEESSPKHHSRSREAHDEDIVPLRTEMDSYRNRRRSTCEESQTRSRNSPDSCCPKSCEPCCDLESLKEALKEILLRLITAIKQSQATCFSKCREEEEAIKRPGKNILRQFSTTKAINKDDANRSIRIKKVKSEIKADVITNAKAEVKTDAKAEVKAEDNAKADVVKKEVKNTIVSDKKDEAIINKKEQITNTEREISVDLQKSSKNNKVDPKVEEEGPKISLASRISNKITEIQNNPEENDDILKRVRRFMWDTGGDSAKKDPVETTDAVKLEKPGDNTKSSVVTEQVQTEKIEKSVEVTPDVPQKAADKMTSILRRAEKIFSGEEDTTTKSKTVKVENEETSLKSTVPPVVPPVVPPKVEENTKDTDIFSSKLHTEQEKPKICKTKSCSQRNDSKMSTAEEAKIPVSANEVDNMSGVSKRRKKKFRRNLTLYFYL